MRSAKPKTTVCGWFLSWSCLVLLVEEISSWSNGPHPAVTTKGVGKVTPRIEKGAIDPAKALEEHLDRAGATRFCEIGCSTKYGRGLVARRDMQPGETAMRIPLSEAIIVDASRSKLPTPIGDAWAGQLAKKLSSERQKQTKPKYFFYSDALPPPPPTPSRGDWSIEALQTLEDGALLTEIEKSKVWRNQQWEIFGVGDGALGDQQRFLDALDLVSSRTIRCGSKFMLVPFLDMANYASRDHGGGYYTLVEGSNGREEIELKVGDREVKAGDEIFLDYGDRSNGEWLVYYGFLPDRNPEESLVLPYSQREITWDDVNCEDESLKEECETILNQSSTSLSGDIETLNMLEMDYENNDSTMALALKYRIARKTLISAVAGAKSSSVFCSAFL